MSKQDEIALRKILLTDRQKTEVQDNIQKDVRKKQRRVDLCMAILLSAAIGAVYTYVTRNYGASAAEASKASAPMMYASNTGISVLVGLVALILRLGKLGRFLAKKFRTNIPKAKYFAINSLPVALIYTALISFALNAFGVWQTRSVSLDNIPAFLQTILSHMSGNVFTTFIVSYIIALFLLPVLSAIFKLAKWEDIEFEELAGVATTCAMTLVPAANRNSVKLAKKFDDAIDKYGDKAGNYICEVLFPSGKRERDKEKTMGSVMALIMSAAMGAIAPFVVRYFNENAAKEELGKQLTLSIGLSVILGLIIAFVLPLGRLGRGLARKANAEPPGFKFTVLNALPISIINSLIISLALSAFNTFMARSNMPPQAPKPQFFAMWFSGWWPVFLVTLVASYILACILSPIVSSIVGLNKNAAAEEDDD